MKMSKKALSLLLCASLSMTLFAGCKNEKTSDDKEVKTVTIWAGIGHSKQYWENKIEEFNNTIGKEKGIKIEMEANTDASYSQKVDIAMQSDDLPDIFDGGDLKKMVELDRIVPIDELPGVAPLVEQYKDCLSENTHKVNGKTYCLISGATTRGLIYNKDMFKKAGLVDENGEPTPPKTFSELREYAKKLTNDAEMQYGMVFPLKWSSWVESDIRTLAQSSFGIPCYDPIKQEYDYTVLKPIIETYLGMKADGSIFPGAEGLDNDPARARFAEGGIGMKIAYSFDVGVFTTQFPAQFDWGVAPLPVMDENDCYKQFSIFNNGMRVSKKGMERHGEDVIGTVLSWWYGDENVRNLYAEGLEIPPVWDVVSDMELSDNMTQWKAFCEMQSISANIPLVHPTDMSGKQSLKELIINEIWGKGASLDLLDDYTKEANAGIKRYKELHPDYDYSIYDYTEWDIKRK